MADEAKASVLDRVAAQGFTSSYGSLLFHAALLGTDPEILAPRGDEERFEWRGHNKGLQAALVCLVMHEQQLDPELAVMVVMTHVEEAMALIATHVRDAAGGMSCPTGA